MYALLPSKTSTILLIQVHALNYVCMLTVNLVGVLTSIFTVGSLQYSGTSGAGKFSLTILVHHAVSKHSLTY